MEKLILNETEIKIDEFGRYSLTDLWKASGLGRDKQPTQFLRTGGLKRLVEKLKLHNHSFEPLITTKGRYHGGTWAVKHIVYKYAMWVDVDFEIKVIETFDAAVRGYGDLAVSTAKGLDAYKEAVKRRDLLLLTATTQKERDEVERLSSIINRDTSTCARVMNMSRGKGRKFIDSEIERINKGLQIDIFEGKLK